MTGFVNFVVVFGVIGALVWAFNRWSARRRARSRLTEMGEASFAEAVNGISRNTQDLPQAVLEGVAFMTFVLSEGGKAENFLEGAFMAERTYPTGEGEFAFSDPVDRERVHAAAHAMMGLLFLRSPKRWRPYADEVKADPSLPVRAAIAGANGLLSVSALRGAS